MVLLHLLQQRGHRVHDKAGEVFNRKVRVHSTPAFRFAQHQLVEAIGDTLVVGEFTRIEPVPFRFAIDRWAALLQSCKVGGQAS